MEIEKLQERLLTHVQREDYQPVKPRVLGKQLGITEDDRPLFRKALKKLIKAGKIEYGDRHLVQLANQEDRVIGEFSRAAGGYGFVRPAGTKREVGRAADIYIPWKKSRDAASGDKVAVRVREGNKGRDGEARTAGEIIEILERETHQFVGTYFESAGMGLVRVDGNVFSRPITVGDAGAKGANPHDLVVIEMVRFPSHVRDGEGVLIELLGKRGDPGVDTRAIMREFNLPDSFPEEVLESAREQADKFDESIGKHRSDLTEATIITIDPVDARDFDDAISLERIENGHWRLGVHIADVAHFVPEKSPLDIEARDRATSVYLPDRVLPMLPEVISNNLASLQPDCVRYAKTVFIEFTADGAHVATEGCSSAIRSKRRFAYEEVDAFLEDKEPWREKLTPEIFGLLERMRELALILRKRRSTRGGLELSLPEIKIDLDNQGQVVGAHRESNTESHQIIEAFMLAANEAVAAKLQEEEILFLRRVHASPDPRKLKTLTTFVNDLGISCESLESRFEMQRVLAHVKDQPEEHAVNFAILRSMQKAIYSPDDEGHFALSSDCYCHFTSPIRRYPDLVVHRQLDALYRGKKPVGQLGSLVVLGEHCSEREQRAEKAERELTKMKLLLYLRERIGETMDAVVTGVQDFGIFVMGLEIPAEGLIHIRSLADDYYHYDDATHSLTGRRKGNVFRLGDTMHVEITKVNIESRELDFRLIRLIKHARSSDRSSQGHQPKKSANRKSKRKKGR